MGRKRLLTISSLGGLISLFALGFGLDSGISTLSSLAIVTFVMYVPENHHHAAISYTVSQVICRRAWSCAICDDT